MFCQRLALLGQIEEVDSGASITNVAEQLGQVPATTAAIYSHALKKGGSIKKLLK